MQIDAVSEVEQRTVARVAGAVAHELNNPLQGILSLVAVTLRDCRLDQRCQLRLEQIRRGVTRIARTVETLSAVYENLPRTPDFLPPALLLDRFAFEFSHREMTLQVLPSEPLLLPVVCFAPEIAKLAGDLFAERFNDHSSVQLTMKSAAQGVEVQCEFNNGVPPGDVWLPGDQMRGVSGVAVLLDEVVRLSRGSVEFRMSDSQVDGMKIVLLNG
jgi:signal transduction histidine kinase